MGQIVFNILSAKNEGSIIGPSDLSSLFLSGIPMTNGLSKITYDNIKFYINAAQNQVEKFLGIKINRQLINEDRFYFIDEFYRFGYIQTSYSVSIAIGLDGYFGKTKQISYPKDWLISKKDNKSRYYRRISIVPNGASTMNYGNTFPGITYHRLLIGADQIPEYWNATYITGFDKVDDIPYDLINVICKMAAIDILNKAGDNILGPGLTGSTLSIDGLSQSMQTSKSSTAGAFGHRMAQYLEDIKQALPTLSGYYKGISFTTC